MKMNKYLIILLFLFLISVKIHAQAIDTENLTSKEASTTNIEFSILENIFVSEELAVSEKQAFEQRATQKLYDYYDYVELISYQNLDKALKDYTIKQIIDLFNEDISVFDDFTQIIQEDFENLENYINNISKLKIEKIEIEVSDLQFIQQLEIKSKNIYTGKIAYQIKYQIIEEGSVINTFSQRNEIEIILKKIEKNFGNETKKIWQIFLGNIYQI